MSDSLQPHELYSPWNSPGQSPRVGGLFLLQGIFPTQGLNPGLWHCRQILYQLSHKGSPISIQKYLLSIYPAPGTFQAVSVSSEQDRQRSCLLSANISKWETERKTCMRCQMVIIAKEKNKAVRRDSMGHGEGAGREDNLVPVGDI